MAKTYGPQLVRLLRHVRAYINKHRTTLNGVCTGPQQTALDSIVSAVAAFDSVVVNETP